MTIQIDIYEVAEEMIRWGIKPSNIKQDIYEAWSDTILDILEEKYDIETKITKLMKTDRDLQELSDDLQIGEEL